MERRAIYAPIFAGSAPIPAKPSPAAIELCFSAQKFAGAARNPASAWRRSPPSLKGSGLLDGQERAQILRLFRISQPLESLGLDLADSLARQPKVAGDFR